MNSLSDTFDDIVLHQLQIVTKTCLVERSHGLFMIDMCFAQNIFVFNFCHSCGIIGYNLMVYINVSEDSLESISLVGIHLIQPCRVFSL